MLKVGQRVKRFVEVQKDPCTVATTIGKMEGEVVFVHPKGRFHTVEFEYPRGEKLRWTYDGVI